MKHTSLLLRDMYGTEAMRTLWDEPNLVQKWLDVEAALVVAHAELGTIPPDAAATIIAQCQAGEPTAEMIITAKAELKHIMVAFIDAFTRRCGPSGEYFHLGATTQDILDTGLTLQARDSLTLLLDDMIRLQETLLELMRRHKTTVMMGRTHAQHAGPMTFGLKVAIWASEVSAHMDRLLQCAERLLFVSLSGAVGTNASFVHLMGQDGTRRFHQLVSERLGLAAAHVDLHQRTDRFHELLDVLALIGATLGKIGLEISELQRTEVGELAVPWKTGRHHGSSTMPHKRNPSDAETLAGLAGLLRGNAAVLSSQPMQHERDAGWMTLAFACIPDSFLLLAAGLKGTVSILEGLHVNEETMIENLGLEGGLAMSEALMLTIFRKTGKKHSAHQACFDACNIAREEGRPVVDVFLHDEQFQGLLDEPELGAALDPSQYIGNSQEQVEAVKQHALARRRDIDARRCKLGI